MAAAISASSPAAVTGTGTAALTSASFTPPVGALLVAIGSTGNSSGSGVQSGVFTDSLSGTWTGVVSANTSGQGCVIVASRPIVSSVAMTVTYTPSGATGKGSQIKIYVITGQSTVGATATATAATVTTLSITPAATGSAVLMGLTYTDTGVSLTANAASTTDLATNDGTNGETYGKAHAVSATTSGTPVSVGFTTTGLVSVQMAVVEVKPSTGMLAPAGTGVSATSVVLTAPIKFVSTMAARSSSTGATTAVARLILSASSTSAAAVGLSAAAQLLPAATAVPTAITAINVALGRVYEFVVVSDRAVASLRHFPRSSGDTISVSDVPIETIRNFRTISDAFSISETPTRITGKGEHDSFSFTIFDSCSVSIHFTASDRFSVLEGVAQGVPPTVCYPCQATIRYYAASAVILNNHSVASLGTYTSTSMLTSVVSASAIMTYVATGTITGYGQSKATIPIYNSTLTILPYNSSAGVGTH